LPGRRRRATSIASPPTCTEVEAALRCFPNLRQNAVAVKVHAPDGVPAVPPIGRIARVLRSLTENAAQYTPPHGKLDIRIEANAGRVRVEYSNDGGELTAADLPYIFERFYRGDKSGPAARRSGDRLAIVKELVEAHGGRVGADLSHNTVRIWFELPAILLLVRLTWLFTPGRIFTQSLPARYTTFNFLLILDQLKPRDGLYKDRIRFHHRPIRRCPMKALFIALFVIIAVFFGFRHARSTEEKMETA